MSIDIAAILDQLEQRLMQVLTGTTALDTELAKLRAEIAALNARIDHIEAQRLLERTA